MNDPMRKPYTKFIFLTDLHWGYERRSGHKVALHDAKAASTALAFAADFKPDVVVLGGDILDCSAVSHHNKNKPGLTEGLRLADDAAECREAFIEPLERLKAKDYVYILGNHDGGWLSAFEADHPGITGTISAKQLLGLDRRWDMIDQGDYYDLGKLMFCHGDQLSGGEHVAKAAVIACEKSVRFGHFHSHQVYSKNTPLTNAYPKTGISVPCLCRKNPSYGKGAPNKWSQGFLYGYVLPDGNYHDYVVTIIGGRTVVAGHTYGR